MPLPSLFWHSLARGYVLFDAAGVLTHPSSCAGQSRPLSEEALQALPNRSLVTAVQTVG